MSKICQNAYFMKTFNQFLAENTDNESMIRQIVIYLMTQYDNARNPAFELGRMIGNPGLADYIVKDFQSRNPQTPGFNRVTSQDVSRLQGGETTMLHDRVANMIRRYQLSAS